MAAREKLVVWPPPCSKTRPCTQKTAMDSGAVRVRTDAGPSMEAMQVYHLTIQENGHSRRFVYEDRDER